MSEETSKYQLFGKWRFEGVEALDQGLKQYISLRPLVIPHSMGRHEHKKFHKSRVNIVERLVNNLMRPGPNSGKKTMSLNFVRNAFEIIHLRNSRNPIEVLVRAVENSAPCEDTTRISFGGVAYHQSVDISPQRRVDLALRYLTEGVRKASFSNPRPFEEILAEEIMLAAEKDLKSYAISKRNEMERVAMHAR